MKLLLLLCTIGSCFGQVYVQYTPEPLAVLAPLHLKTIQPWAIRACNNSSTDTVTLAPERIIMGAPEVNWIEAPLTTNILTAQQQKSTAAEIAKWAGYGLMVGTAATGFGAIAASTRVVAGLAGGAIVGQQVQINAQAEIPSLGPYTSNALNSPVVLAAGQCGTWTLFSGLMKNQTTIGVTLNLPRVLLSAPPQ